MKKILLIIISLAIVNLLFASILVNIISFKMLMIFVVFAFLMIVFLNLLKHSVLGKKAVARIRGIVYNIIYIRNKMGGEKLSIGENVTIAHPDCISFGRCVTIDHDAEFYPVGIYNGVEYPSKIRIGNNVHIGAYNRFASKDLLEIEDDVLFAAYVHITDHSHEYRDIDIPIHKQGVFGKGPVKIGKGSWIGLRCSILSGVTVGDHSVVAAGAIVVQDVPPYSVVAGVPARVVKRYDFGEHVWKMVK